MLTISKTIMIILLTVLAFIFAAFAWEYITVGNLRNELEKANDNYNTEYANVVVLKAQIMRQNDSITILQKQAADDEILRIAEAKKTNDENLKRKLKPAKEHGPDAMNQWMKENML